VVVVKEVREIQNIYQELLKINALIYVYKICNVYLLYSKCNKILVHVLPNP
jgi:hypothetical protein